MNRLITLLVLFNTSLIFAQRQTFDIASFVPPNGWQNETRDYAASYTTTNNLTQGWCRVTLYKSMLSNGDAMADFNSEWPNLITKSFPDALMPTPEATTEDGWTSEAGAAKFQFNGQDAAALLTTITGYGVEMSIVVLMNSEEFMPAVESFLASIDLKKPAAEVITQQSQQPTKPAQLAQPILEKVSNNHGISISTITFDDGWVAQPFDDYVKVTKGNTKVFLHYTVAITDAMRNSNDIDGALWDQLIAPRYHVSNVRKYDNGGACYFCIDFFEADAIEKATGKNCHVGFRVITNNGNSNCIEIVSPSAQEFQQNFPDQKKVEALLNYNKFAVTRADLVGEWQESTSSGIDMYSTVTGAYAGMNSTAAANSFIFNNNETYSSSHKGAFGMMGSTTFYDQKYIGNCTITDWDITLTKRFKEKTDIFWAQFEAVRGGRILHITNKEASGISYHLVKTR